MVATGMLGGILPQSAGALGYVTLRDLWVGGKPFDLTITRTTNGHRITARIGKRTVEAEIATGKSYILNVE